MIRFAMPYLLFAVVSVTGWAQSAQISIKQPVHGIPTGGRVRLVGWPARFQ